LFAKLHASVNHLTFPEISWLTVGGHPPAPLVHSVSRVNTESYGGALLRETRVIKACG